MAKGVATPLWACLPWRQQRAQCSSHTLSMNRQSVLKIGRLTLKPLQGGAEQLMSMMLLFSFEGGLTVLMWLYLENGSCGNSKFRFLSTTANQIWIHLNDLMTFGQQKFIQYWHCQAFLPLALFLLSRHLSLFLSHLILFSSCNDAYLWPLNIFFSKNGGTGTANWKYG